MSDNIKVVVKVRPLIAHEIAEKQHHQWRVKNNTLSQLDNNFGHTFTFDKVYGEDANTSEVYNDVAKPIVEAAVKGFNGTIFAYGQTSSGKTYTMTGTDDSPGIIPLAVLNLFEIIKNIPGRDFVVSVSYLEIYNETLRDLLDLNKTQLKVQDTFNGTKVVGLTEKATASPEEVLEAMNKGLGIRQTGSTNMNENSSRSHSIFQITIESRQHLEGEEQMDSVNVSQLNLVDLAGSERAGQTGATGLRFKEGTHINKSLLALAQVINQLSEEPNKYINYRDSKLTRILQNSLGGNAKTSIICAVTPAALEETTSTLQFATRAKTIKNKPEVNAVSSNTADPTMIHKLTKQLSNLQMQLENKEVLLKNKKNVEQDLQKQIANLQRFILNGQQRPAAELMGGNRRKLQQPRRITISSLHSFKEEVPKVVKFHTPALKYNPAQVLNPPDFMPIQNTSKLASLPEEPVRLITPPPNQRKVVFSNEVIEIDSDDDECSSTSPYHKCQDATKTPPCILRKNARQAERNLQDLIELTDREKMYPPSVVELMEKIEQQNEGTAALLDELERLQSSSKEKDFEIEKLRSKINSTENDMKSISTASFELETQCKDFKTKLTDWEVTYETLKTKAKLREHELLSLLEEQRIKQTEDIGKMASKPKDKESFSFMDMSKDISLVNSDNESSIVHPDEDGTFGRTNVLMKDMQAQLVSKNELINDLETDINTQKQRIEDLEKSSRDLLGQVNNLKEKLVNIENENVLMQSTVKELTTTVNVQKENLELANNDMISYNSVIQELQVKLSKQENLLNVHVSDTVLENMLANEQKTIANNENFKNIIYLFKNALENSKKENDLLKSKMQNSKDTEENVTTGDVESIAKPIELLNDEISRLKKQANENMLTIDTLFREKNDLAVVEQELIKKLFELEQINREHDILNKENRFEMKNIKKDKDCFEITIADLSKKEQQLSSMNETLVKQINEEKHKIAVLEKDNKTKNSLLEHLKKQNTEFYENLTEAKQAMKKIYSILSSSGENPEVPEVLESCEVVYNSLHEVALDIVSQKKLYQKNNADLQKEIDDIVRQNQIKLTEVEEKNKDLTLSEQKYTKEIELLKSKLNEQSNELEKLQLTLNKKNIELGDLETQLKVLKTANNNEMIEKNTMISSYQQQQNSFQKKIEELESEVTNLRSAFKSKEEMHQYLINKEQLTTQKLNELEEELHLKSKRLIETEQKLRHAETTNDQLIANIICKLSNIIETIKDKNIFIENHLMSEKVNARDRILPILDAVVNHVILPVNNENKELRVEIETLNNFNRSLKCDLQISSELLEQLKVELKVKAAEIDAMQSKVKEWKEQFSNFDETMKEQMLFLHTENDNLKVKMQLDQLTDKDKAQTSPKKHVTTLGAECENNGQNKSPRSLLTICCDRIIESMDSKQGDTISVTTTSSCVGNSNTETSLNTCTACEQLSSELRVTQQESNRLIEIVSQLEYVNEELMKEQSLVREEVRLLIEPAQELQKKIINHRTTFSTLTATSYAENKSLKSQVKGLQHHHSRFYNVCQRDIPEFKKQLNELMNILKDDSSFCEGSNFNYKRYSLPSLPENNQSQIKNESVLDGDLLMIDTNISLTTADNTVVGYNQTCSDLNQTMFNETLCQTCDNNISEVSMIRHQMDSLRNDYEDISLRLKILAEENMKLKDHVSKRFASTKTKVDAEISPIKEGTVNFDAKCTNCENTDSEVLRKKLTVAIEQKDEIRQKYNDLELEMPSTDALLNKIRGLEADINNKMKEVNKITNTLQAKTKELKALQDENDALSTQVIDHLTETDYLNKEVNTLKIQNQMLLEQCRSLESEKGNMIDNCHVCNAKDNIVGSMHNIDKKSHSKVNRSLSDSDTTSRHNKICTLQSQIHAGREDCEKLTDDVANIKRHLDNSNIMSMDLDQSLNDFELANDVLPASPRMKTCDMPDIHKERTLDVYKTELNDCYNYYVDKTGDKKETLMNDIKIIEIMKLLHNNLVTKHSNEVENLLNQLSVHDETKNSLETNIKHLNAEYAKIKRNIEEKENTLKLITKVVTQLRDNLNNIRVDSEKAINLETHRQITLDLKEMFLTVIDNNFNLTSVNIFEQICNKYESVLNDIEKQRDALQSHVNKLTSDIESVNNVLAEFKFKLSEKENEYNLIKAHNEKILEINNAVTLDIVKKEQENTKMIRETYEKMVKINVIDPIKNPLCEPSDIKNMILLLEHAINEYQKDNAKQKLSIEVDSFKVALQEKEKELRQIKSHNEFLQRNNEKNTLELSDKDDEIQKLKWIEHEMTQTINIKLEQNSQNLKIIESLSLEVNQLKETIDKKQQMILSLSDKDAKVTELLGTIKGLQENNNQLKTVNEMISKEIESYASELRQSSATIKQNNIDIQKMTSEILTLREAMQEATIHIGKMKQEIEALSKENSNLKQELEVKSSNCTRLETNIKTHEKTAELQNRMIKRLKKLKEDDDKAINEKQTDLADLKEKFLALQSECEALKNAVKTANEEIQGLKATRNSLENRLTESEESVRRSRTSLDAIAESSKKRRQSLHDSKRLFEELEEHKNLEAVFESREKPTDLFMDVDDDTSGRSTPFGLGKGRDSLLSRTDHSDKDEDHSRPNSVVAIRRRRQSSHDLRRSVTPHAPSPHDLSNYVIDELKADTSRNTGNDNEVSMLKKQLACCEQELEELKERYREVDEECETCAEYLHERDAQCMRLSEQKAALQKQVAELKTIVENTTTSLSTPKATFADVSINTDEDWTNLHAVVVDRMSYDAEVEKNKKLTRTVEELRFTKQDLKNTLAKMQKALEKNASKDNRELEQTRLELKACSAELSELKARYKELDEECETCAQYLKEREEQCGRLKEAKHALEMKLQQYQENSKLEHTKSVRKKRQTFHDMHRPETVSADQTDASTEPTEDFLNSLCEVDRDDSAPRAGDETLHDVKNLKKIVEKLSRQKALLERQLKNANAAQPMYVATGSAIVQNQQITDVMKENQKLKSMNAKLVNICKKRGKSEANRENEDPCEQG